MIIFQTNKDFRAILSPRDLRHKKRSSGKKGKEEGETKQQAGTYKTKEEVEKPPKMDHPCNLTRTTVRISFPELKGEVFVNLLGYKEPNLIPLWRCKGRTRSNSFHQSERSISVDLNQ